MIEIAEQHNPRQAALVTGASKRLGRAMVLALARRGTDVAIHYYSSGDEAQALVREATSLGVCATAIQADFLREAEVERLVARATEELRRPLSVLVNNASVFESDTITDATRKSWDRHIETNLRAPFVLVQKFAAQVAKSTVDHNGEPVARGCIVNLVDQRVAKPTPYFATYTVSKMALWDFTRTAALALAPRIRVNAIGPGPTLLAERQSVLHFQQQRQATILNRGANPGDVVAALVYILESPSLTGQLICVDGGQHLGWRP